MNRRRRGRNRRFGLCTAIRYRSLPASLHQRPEVIIERDGLGVTTGADFLAAAFVIVTSKLGRRDSVIAIVRHFAVPLDVDRGKQWCHLSNERIALCSPLHDPLLDRHFIRRQDELFVRAAHKGTELPRCTRLCGA